MTEYQIQAHTRRCTGTGRELRPGEKFYTVLVDENGQLLRQDFSQEAWQGPPGNSFGFWSGRVPAESDSRRPRFDGELLMDCFQRLEGQHQPDRLNFRYIVALLLMRQKRLRFEEIATEGDREIMVLRCTRTRSTHRVVNPGLSDDEMQQAQDEVFKVLGWE